jgi:hypothetical protein
MNTLQKHKFVHETAAINFYIIIKGKVHILRMHIPEILYVIQASRCMSVNAGATVHIDTTDLTSKGYVLISWKERRILLHIMLNS